MASHLGTDAREDAWMAIANMGDFRALEPFFLDRCFDLRVHRADDSTVTLEYASEGTVTATGRPYGNQYISVVTIRNRKIVHWRDYLDPLRVFAAFEGPGTTDSPSA